MTASTSLFSCTAQFFGNGTVDWDNDAIKVALLTSNYTFNQTSHTQYLDVVSSGTIEIAAGNGYVAGGTTCVATVTRAGTLTTFTLADAVWVASGGSIPAFRSVLVWANITRNAVVNPVLVYGLADITPADIPATVNGATLRIRINTGGLFTSP